MCGIASIVKFDDDTVNHSDLRRMCSAIAHRGPDDAGFAVLNSGRVGLGHVRLSIVDLAGGDQPIFNEDDTIGVICNGEIYDYKQLRQELIEQGHRFRTSSDSEVIVHLYEQHGMDFLQRLNGEYAFVLWDGIQQRLIAAKDRCGIKPLYYHVGLNELVLCSEVKGIYSLSRIERRLSPRYLAGPALGVYLKDASAFANVKNLNPGHYLIADMNGHVVEHEYFRPEFNVDESMEFEDAAEAVRREMTAAVRRRMVADVPVNSYLSGGIDSTIVCGLMAEAGAKFTAYNVGFPGTPYDESEKARQIANYFGQNIESTPCNPEQIAQNIERAVYCVETPLANYNSVAKMLLSGFVRSHQQKVCLTGEGSDELFAGYPYFKLESIWRMRQGDESEVKRAEGLWGQFCATEARSEGLLWDHSDRWKKATGLFGYPSFFQYRARNAGRVVGSLFRTKELGFKDEHKPLSILRDSVDFELCRQLHPLNASRLISFNQLHNVVIPSLGDRVEMANSLECRTPFLDRNLLDLTGMIPPRHFMDIDRLREKHLLREAFKDVLPPFLEKEHKHPFLSPSWATFARTQAGREVFGDFLSRESIRRAGIFRPGIVALYRNVWRWSPLRRGVARQLDALIGVILSVQILNRMFVENAIRCDPYFPMKDRTPTVTASLAESSRKQTLDRPAA